MHASQVILAPILSEKSYAGTTRGSYTFKVHSNAHKTQIRQAVEELFERQGRARQRDQGSGEAEAPRRLQGHASGLEEGRRAAARR